MMETRDGGVFCSMMQRMHVMELTGLGNVALYLGPSWTTPSTLQKWVVFAIVIFELNIYIESLHPEQHNLKLSDS